MRRKRMAGILVGVIAVLYKKGESAYLCWTYSPEFSYVLKYNPTVVSDSEIIKMTESVKEWEGRDSVRCLTKH